MYFPFTPWILRAFYTPCCNDCSNACQYIKKSCSSFRKELLYSIVIELIVSMKATELSSMCLSKSITESVYISIRQKHWYHEYTGCPSRNVPDFGRVFLMLKYDDITQNTYVQSWMVMEIMAREKYGLLAGPRTVPVSWQSYPCPSLSVVSYDGNSAHDSHKLHMYFLQGDDVVSHVT